MTYTVVLLKEEVGGYSVVVPALPGCFSEGETMPEALEHAQEAIRCHVASLRKHGEQVPDDVETVAFDWGESQEAYACRVTVRELEAAPVA